MLRFSSHLQKGTLKQRYKRFFADVELPDGRVVVSHCPNTGSMKSCAEPGSTVYLLEHNDPKRKLAFTWELTETHGGFIGVNTARPNQVVSLAIESGEIPELAGYDTFRREVKYGRNSKIDVLLSDANGEKPDCYVEIKNVTLFREGQIQFPDAVTSRGLKHLEELSLLTQQKKRAVMFFFVNRPEGDTFSVAHDIDPAYARGLVTAQHAGVEILIYRSRTTLEGIGVGAPVALHWHDLN